MTLTEYHYAFTFQLNSTCIKTSSVDQLFMCFTCPENVTCSGCIRWIVCVSVQLQTQMHHWPFFSLLWAPWNKNPVGLCSWHASQGAMSHLSIFWKISTLGMKYKADINHFALWSPNGTQVSASFHHDLHKHCLRAGVMGCFRCQSDVCRCHAVSYLPLPDSMPITCTPCCISQTHAGGSDVLGHHHSWLGNRDCWNIAIPVHQKNMRDTLQKPF